MKSGSIKVSIPIPSIQTNAAGSKPASAAGARTVQEQLRADHIEALAEISRLTKENDELQKRVDSLQKSAKSMNQVEESATTTSAVELLQEVKKFRDSNLALSSENNRLKEQLKRAANEEKLKFQQQLADSSAEFTLQIRRLQDQLKSMETHNNSLHAQLESFQQSMTVSEESVESVQKKLQLLQIQYDDALTTLSDRDRTLQFVQEDHKALKEQITLLQRDHIDSQMRINELEQHAETLSKSNQLLTDTSSEQEQRILSLDAENEHLRIDGKASQDALHRLQQEIAALQRRINHRKKIDKYGDSDSDDDNHNVPKPQASLVVQKESISIQTDISTTDQSHTIYATHNHLADDGSVGGDDESQHPQSFRFQEFLKVKRENRELKLRLADREAAQQAQWQQQQHAQPRTLMSMTGGLGNAQQRGNNKFPRSSTTPLLPKLSL